MIELMVILGLALALMPIAVIILLIRQARFARDIRTLKEDVAALQGAGAPTRQPAVEARPQVTVDPSADARTEAPVPDVEPSDTGRQTPTVPVAPVEKAAQAGGEEAPLPPRAVVFRADRLAALGGWLRANWFLAIAALSLALAGVFLVQYGAETGLLSPALRVSAAIVLGALLIALGEWIRRRAGDRSGATAFLPSAVSGAGLVCIFAGVLAARQLYGLIGAETAFAGLVATGALALVSGWFYGPLLSSVGIIGAMAAPFLVGGDASAPALLYAYFALVTMVGLGIDAAWRWAWVSVLSLTLGFGAGALLHLGAGGDIAYLALAVALAAASIAIPERTLTPRHGGAMSAESLVLRCRGKTPVVWPEFPTRLAAGAMIAASVICVLLAGAVFWPAMIALGLLFVLVPIWARRAGALSDLALVPAAAYLLTLWLLPRAGASVVGDFAASGAAEGGTPMLASLLLAGGVAASVIAGWRGLRGAPYPAVWTAGAALFAPAVAVLLHLGWAPWFVLGSGAWGAHLLAVAAVMTVLAERHARVAERRDLRVSLMALAALGMIVLALFTLMSGAALTVALAMTALAAAWLDRQFRLPQLAPFILAAVALTLWRLVAEPGVEWAMRAGTTDMLATYLLPLAAFSVGREIARRQGRALSTLALETGLWVGGGTLACVLIGRAVPGGTSFLGLPPYWEASLYGSVWLIAAGGQLNLMRREGWLRVVHMVLAALFGLLALIPIGAALTLFNPLFERTPVLGPLPFDTLLVAYGLPAALMALGAWWLSHLDRRVRLAAVCVAAGLATVFVGLEIRHFWHGDILSMPGTTAPELYSYTLALMAASALLFLGAVRRRSPGLRRLALGVAAVSIAKVFLIDMAGLTGLIRVAAFLGLGLALVALAWLDRRITTAHDLKNDATPPPDERP